MIAIIILAAILIGIIIWAGFTAGNGSSCGGTIGGGPDPIWQRKQFEKEQEEKKKTGEYRPKEKDDDQT